MPEAPPYEVVPCAAGAKCIRPTGPNTGRLIPVDGQERHVVRQPQRFDGAVFGRGGAIVCSAECAVTIAREWAVERTVFYDGMRMK